MTNRGIDAVRRPDRQDPTAPAPAPKRSGRLVEHLRTPLHRNAYALVASGGITSVLGLVYWIFAARHYTEDEVGLGAAAVSSMVLLANASGLGLQNGFVRLIPSAGGRTRWFVVRAMAGAALTAGLLATLFLVGLDLWAPRLAPLLHASVWTSLAFVGAVVVWVLFVLQDTALIGLRRATIVPVENLGFSLGKILVVVALAGALPSWGVFASWSLSAMLAVLVVSGSVLPRVLTQASLTSRRDELPDRSGLLRYLGAEHLTVILWMATVELIPLVVLQRLGASFNAYYYLSAQLSSALMLLPTAIGVSLTAEAASDPSSLQAYVRKGARNIVVVLVPVVGVVVVFAPIVLRLFGPGYREEATGLLRLMALSSLPYAATMLMMSVARVQRRMKVIMATYFAVSASTFGLTLLFLGPLGLVGAGLAALISQTLVAAVTVTMQLHRVGVRLLDRAVLAVVSRPRQWVWRTKARRVVESALPTVTGLGTVHSIDVLPTRNDVIVARLRTSEHGTQMFKMSESPGAAAAVRRAAGSMERIRTEVPSFAPLIPRVTMWQILGSRMCSLEEYCPGDSGTERLASRSLGLKSLSSALDAVGVLHAATDRVIVADGEWLRGSVTGPIARIRSHATSPVVFEQLAQLQERLERELSGRKLHVSTIHGDLAPGNMLFDLETGELRAFVDWESSRTDALPEVDLFQFLLALHTAVDGEELDESVPRLVDGSTWPLRDGALVDDAVRSTPNLDQLGLWTVVAIAWLAHVDTNLAKARWYRTSPRWIERNLDTVLARLTSDDLVVDSRRPTFRNRVSPSVPTAGPAGAPSIIELRDELAPFEAAMAIGDGERIGGVSTAVRQSPSDLHGRGALVVTPGVAAHRWEPRSRGARVLARPTVVVPVAVAAWIGGVWGIDLRAMSSIGLLSVIRPVAYLGLALLLASIVVNLVPQRPRASRLAVLLSAFIVLVHGTPAAIYAALRYSWAWKHVGIVEFVVREGGVDPDIARLGVYHQWPGFFAAAASLTDAVGADTALTIASWAPVAFNLMNLVMLLFVLGSLTSDRRVVWLGATLFFVTNWVGQDYFSPQALAFVLHLGVLAMVLQRFRRTPVDLPGRSWDVKASAIVICALIVAISTSHQLTPVMLIGSLLVLAATRHTRTWLFGLFAAAVNVVWFLTVARPFMSTRISGMIDRFGAITENTSGTISDTSLQSSGQAIVSTMGRLGLLVAGLLALVGFVRRWRAGRREWIPALLIVVAGSVLVANDYGGEAVFRSVLFAMPFVSLLGAHALVPRDGRPWGTARGLAVMGVTGVLLTAFLFGYYGKERQYSFTADEVAAVDFIERQATPDTLLVTLNSNYPNLVSGYERFTPVSVLSEPAESRSRVFADPDAALADWLDNVEYRSGFILVSRGQVISASDIGEATAADLEELLVDLRDSDRLAAVFQTPDAAVYRLVPPATTSTATTATSLDSTSSEEPS